MDHALLRNSLNYYPVISAEINSIAQKNKTYKPFDELTQTIMNYVMSNDETWFIVATTQIDKLKLILRDNNLTNKPEHPYLTNYLAHSELIVNEKRLQTQRTSIELEHPINTLIDSLHGAYLDHYSYKTRNAETYRSLMLMASLSLALIIVYIMILLGRNTRTLAIEKRKALVASHSKSAFLANMSHEIRTPLTAIIGFGETILDSNQSIEERLTAVRTIVRNGKHLLHVINEILDISKIESGKLEIEILSVELSDLLKDVDSVVQLQAEDKVLDFKLLYDSPLPNKIETDPVRLKQILLNLCNNAVKFTEYGCVELRVKCLPDQQKILFSVIDTGIGLTQAQIDKLFNPFSQADTSTTRKFGGSGLGLHISKKLADHLGGDISIKSTAGQGSQVDVIIDTGPLEGTTFTDKPKPDNQSSPIPRKPGTPPKLTGNVLLVEDNTDNQQLITFYIHKTGASITFANNGKEAVDTASHTEFDLILMDMQMPVMDGIEATKQLRQTGYSKPIVALTANAFDEEEINCLQAGCNGFLTKPVDWTKFFQVLADHLTIEDGDSSETQPLTSELLEEDPGLKDLVNKFIQRLPETLATLNQLYQDQDWQTLAQNLHNLKGMGGGFGYPQITTLAARMEFEAKKKDQNELSSSLDELASLVSRIRAGGSN